jgi:hypothetical protein
VQIQPRKVQPVAGVTESSTAPSSSRHFSVGVTTPDPGGEAITFTHRGGYWSAVATAGENGASKPATAGNARMQAAARTASAKARAEIGRLDRIRSLFTVSAFG